MQAASIHVAMGYAKKKVTVVPNGFDLKVFRPDPEARLHFGRNTRYLTQSPAYRNGCTL
jgi:hypothetical protein